MSRPTFVAVRHLEIAGQVFHHGAEIIPDLLSQDEVDKLIDAGAVKEHDPSERRSLYRLLHLFSGCCEHEPLSHEEIDSYCLPK